MKITNDTNATVSFKVYSERDGGRPREDISVAIAEEVVLTLTDEERRDIIAALDLHSSERRRPLKEVKLSCPGSRAIVPFNTPSRCIACGVVLWPVMRGGYWTVPDHGSDDGQSCAQSLEARAARPCQINPVLGARLR